MSVEDRRAEPGGQLCNFGPKKVQPPRGDDSLGGA